MWLVPKGKKLVLGEVTTPGAPRPLENSERKNCVCRGALTHTRKHALTFVRRCFPTAQSSFAHDTVEAAAKEKTVPLTCTFSQGQHLGSVIGNVFTWVAEKKLTEVDAVRQ